jgi:hypothetical protein
MLHNHVVEPFPIGMTSIHDRVVLLHGKGDRDALVRPCNVRRCFGTRSLRHVGSARGGVFAQSCRISL